jgi:hypothetical protein
MDVAVGAITIRCGLDVLEGRIAGLRDCRTPDEARAIAGLG